MSPENVFKSLSFIFAKDLKFCVCVNVGFFLNEIEKLLASNAKCPLLLNLSSKSLSNGDLSFPVLLNSDFILNGLLTSTLESFIISLI